MASGRKVRNDPFDALQTAEPEDTASQIIGDGTQENVARRQSLMLHLLGTGRLQ
ncbi:hypothetical protein PG995_015678 [Apiospora arundinis]|uniref:Uncharacterized protein n=1 Tax=Apiospora arundinis TaxID=335852 RepID=A0ABR2IF81_9PEZI